MNIKALAFTKLPNLLKRFKTIKDKYYKIGSPYFKFIEYFETNYIGGS